jgi:hypothetical protein
VDGQPQVRKIHLIIFFVHKNINDKTNTHTSPNYSKAGPRETKAGHRAKASNGAEAAPKSWFRAGVGIGLRRSEP